MKRILVLAVALLLAIPAQAKPWYKDWKVWAVLGAAAGSQIALDKTVYDCRVRSDVGYCFGQYSEHKAIVGINIGGTVGMAAISLLGRHKGFKEWAAPSLAFTVFNSAQSYHQTVSPPKVNSPDPEVRY